MANGGILNSMTTFARHHVRFLTRRSGPPIAVLLILLLRSPAFAHNGPPFPLFENKKIGPCIVALWTHPDVGTGTFWVLVDPAPGGKVPDDLKVQIGVQPVTRRLPEAFYTADLESKKGQYQFQALVPFDAQEVWQIRLRLSSSSGGGETVSTVLVTPPGFGRWDMLFYAWPFIAVGVMLLVVRIRRRQRMRAARRRAEQQASAPEAASTTTRA